jgi:hypothetical protein
MNLNRLDIPDQTLWSLAYQNRNENYLILTDDGELLLECQLYGIQALRLPSFLILLSIEGIITKNIVSKCITYWIKKNRYQKKDLNRWKKELAVI